VTTDLTPRQAECLRLSAAGLTVPQIHDRIGLAVGTIRCHLTDARAALGARTIAHACALGVHHGIVTAADLQGDA
jgi:DNA-binding CsgD family transcriptional regulator